MLSETRKLIWSFNQEFYYHALILKSSNGQSLNKYLFSLENTHTSDQWGVQFQHCQRWKYCMDAHFTVEVFKVRKLKDNDAGVESS